jgi:hypothetical protein
MAQAQLIQGTAAELIAYLEKRRHQRNLLLIVPEAENAVETQGTYPEGAIIRNGVPLFPTEGRTRIVTQEQVRRLLTP